MSTKKNSGIGINITKAISYLMFTDDCLVFYRATMTATYEIKYNL